MTVQASQGHEPGDTPSKELDRLIGAAADAARVLVGSGPIDRFLRPVTYQDAPDDVLPPPLQEDNPWQLTRRVDGILQQV